MDKIVKEFLTESAENLDRLDQDMVPPCVAREVIGGFAEPSPSV
jgi:hypothetical protein